MADWGSPISGASLGTYGALGIVTPSATINTKGAWVDVGTIGRSGAVIISTGYAYAYSTLRRMLFDFAIGDAGNEQVFLSNLLVTYPANSGAVSMEIVLPITLPPGSTIRARCQSTYASHPGVYMYLASHDIPCSWTGSGVDTYGANTTLTAGVVVTADAAALVWGPYAEITPSCSRFECLFASLTGTAAQNNVGVSQEGAWELALGGAGAEQTIASGVIYASSPSTLVHPSWFGPYFQQVAEGSRLSARLKRAGTAQKTLYMIVHGVK